jgi:hypothetical protein
MGNYTSDAYHGARRQWPRVQAPIGRYVGIELEVSHNAGYQHLLEILPDPPSEDMRPATETDGSLPFATGLEIVFPAFKYKDVQSKTGFLAQTMEVLRVANTRHAAGYGMHVNVNTVGWSQEKCQLFHALIHWMPAINLEHIGGRRLNAYCQQFRMPLANYTEGRWRACTASRENRIECRFPKSTSDHDRLSLIVDFLTLVERYVSVKRNAVRLTAAVALRYTPAISQKVLNDFCAWLANIKRDNASKVREVLLNGYPQ